MVNTAALQNNVRLRIFLILVIAIAIRATRHISIDSIHKATDLLGLNYIKFNDFYSVRNESCTLKLCSGVPNVCGPPKFA